MSGAYLSRPRRVGAVAVVVAAALAALAGCSSGSGSSGSGSSSSTSASSSAGAQAATGDPTVMPTIEAAGRKAMAKYHLKALMVQVTKDGQNLYTGAMGESMTGVPATTDMHFRIGSFGFTYISQVFAKLVDAKKVSLDDKLSTWLPALPSAASITLKNLLNMTSGYADYVYQPELLKAYSRDPFRQWTNAELIRIGVSAPMLFKPGTNWAYSHTNYVILGDVLAKLTGKPVADVIREYVIDPMGLTNTSDNGNTPAIPDPVLHTFSSERRGDLKIPASVPFQEEATFWNPSWTTSEGAVDTSNIADISRSMTIVGSGSQVSPEMHQAQVGHNLVGFGKADPSGKCQACQQNTATGSYGLGVVFMGPWTTQTMNFGGQGATAGYLPADKLTVSVVTTYTAAAFDTSGNYENASKAIFTNLVTGLSPANAPPADKPK